MARKPEQVDVESSENITTVAEVGGVRAHRLERDLGITSIRGLAEATIDELTTVWSIGEKTAMRMKGSAQGHVERFEQEQEEDLRRQREEVFGGQTGGSKVRRVTLLGFPEMRYQAEFGDGGDVTEEIDRESAFNLIELALKRAGIDPMEDNIALGWAVGQYGNDQLGGSYVSSLAMELQTLRSQPMESQTFPTEWDAHEEPIDAIRERNERIKMWSDDVICFKPGVYEETMAWEIGQKAPDHHVRWHSPFSGDLELESRTISDDEATSSHRSKSEPLAQYEKDEEAEAEWEEANAEVDAYDRSEFNPHDEEDADQHLHIWSDSLDQRPEIEESQAGGGEGSANWDLIQPGR